MGTTNKFRIMLICVWAAFIFAAIMYRVANSDTLFISNQPLNVYNYNDERGIKHDSNTTFEVVWN